jgi:acetylornithine deacetylase/succinyl-diaminopimelate desuccinylase-like protein
MKFAIAAFIVALEDLFKKEGKLPSLAVMITADEETGGHDGVEYLIKEIGFRPKLAIVPDGGDNLKIVEKAKGVFHLKLTCRGKAAHGSRPWEGENAIDKMVENIGRIRKAFPQPEKEVWQTTANLGKIMGGKATNQVCDLVELAVDFRYTEEFNKKSLLAKITELCPEAEIEEISHGNNFLIDKKNPAIAKWESLLKRIGASDIFVNEHSASDGRYLSEQGIPTIVSKPVGGNIHSENEWIDLESVADFTKILENFLKEVANVN